MESIAMVGGYSSYLSAPEQGQDEVDSDQCPSSDSDFSFTQPVAARPLDPPCSDTDQDASPNAQLGQLTARDGGAFGYGSELDSGRPL
ncbi:MAG TPA: hypothetical protein VJN22_06480 [Candidatus Eremiobacteraceae bacterium]|nr:hypothetical protein [Candidatus Eremiobacteraceae bacterium]